MFINAVSYTWQQTHFYLTSSMVQVENNLFLKNIHNFFFILRSS